MPSLLTSLVLLWSAMPAAPSTPGCALPAGLDHLPELPAFGSLNLDHGHCNRLINTLLTADRRLETARGKKSRAVTMAELARRLNAYGYPAQAIALYRQSWALSPDFRPPFMLSLIAETEGRHEEALELAEAARELGPGHAPLLAYLARLRLEAGRLDGAVEAATAALARDPALTHARWVLAEAAARSGDPEEVLRQTATALEAAPEADRLHALRAAAFAELGRETEAAQAAALAGSATPSLSGPWLSSARDVPFEPLSDFDLATAALRRSQTAVALAALERAAAETPRDPEVLLVLGRTRRLQDDPAAALEPLRDAVALDDRFETWLELGIVLQALDRTDDAAAAYQRALEHRPEDMMARFWLAECLEERDQLEASLEILDALLDEGFGGPGYLLAAAVTRRLGDEERARRLLEEGVRRFPRDVELARAVADLRRSP